MNTPLIKWTGSKRSIAPQIISHFPKSIETYYEPFVGGGSVFFELLRSNHDVKQYHLSDINKTLILIYKIVKFGPISLCEYYEYSWNELKKDSNFFYKQRDKYNDKKSPHIFYFLTRTCFNGTIRFNSKGEFNVSSHFGRDGMHPDKVKEVIMYYHNLMKDKEILFSVNSFESTNVLSTFDTVYLDPPYTNSKGLYNGNIDFSKLQSWINELPCSWFMNINSVNGADNEEIITTPFTEKKLLTSGKSSFSRMKGKDVTVRDYFYYNLKSI